MCGPSDDLGGIEWEPKDTLSAVARTVIDREIQLKLSTVRFDIFERSIKRFGYTGSVTDTTLAEI